MAYKDQVSQFENFYHSDVACGIDDTGFDIKMDSESYRYLLTGELVRQRRRFWRSNNVVVLRANQKCCATQTEVKVEVKFTQTKFSSIDPDFEQKDAENLKVIVPRRRENYNFEP